jgi:hypothetical protein
MLNIKINRHLILKKHFTKEGIQKAVFLMKVGFGDSGNY